MNHALVNTATESSEACPGATRRPVVPSVTGLIYHPRGGEASFRSGRRRWRPATSPAEPDIDAEMHSGHSERADSHAAAL